ncbi:MAG: restriction endonuclease subunit S [Candidatus Didemnitutus sp.]|nr:restriction endonuclease subunit S [Candidatus Didemnitutus sp.]
MKSAATTTCALGDVVDLVMGQAPSSKETNFGGRGTPFVKVGEFGEFRPVIREWTTNPLRMAKRTDVLLCVVGATCGKINLGEDCAIGRSVAAIRPHTSKLAQFYLYYYMMTLVERLRDGSVGAAQTVISKEMVESVQIPLPSLAEQQRIVAVLDEAFAGLATAQAHAEKNLQNARALFESHLHSVFTHRGQGWAEKTLGDVCEFVGGSQPPKAVFSKTKTPDSIRLIQIRDYKSDNHVVYIPKAQARRFCTADDIMIGRYGPPIFQILRGLDGAYNVALMKAVPDETQINREFLFYFLKHPAILEYVIYHSERAAGQIGVTKETLAPYPIALPSLDKQAEVAADIDALAAETQRLARLYERKLAALAELKKSLLHAAFSGQL